MLFVDGDDYDDEEEENEDEDGRMNGEGVPYQLHQSAESSQKTLQPEHQSSVSSQTHPFRSPSCRLIPEAPSLAIAILF